MNKYQSHKIVEAAKIESVSPVYVDENDQAKHYVDVVVEGGQKFERQRASTFGKLTDDRGYFVRYEDGYTSWSPTKAFEDGYTLCPEAENPTPEAVKSLQAGDASPKDTPAAEIAATDAEHAAAPGESSAPSVAAQVDEPPAEAPAPAAPAEEQPAA